LAIIRREVIMNNNNRGSAVMGKINVEIALANNSDVQMSERGALAADKVRRARISGLVDTGASYLVLPESVANQLGLPDLGTATVRYADQRKEVRRVVHQVEAELFGRRGTFRAVVEPARTDALIGAIVLEDLDLIVDCRTQTLQPRDPKQIITEIE
jgi:predicted aspartyl protease